MLKLSQMFYQCVSRLEAKYKIGKDGRTVSPGSDLEARKNFTPRSKVNSKVSRHVNQNLIAIVEKAVQLKITLAFKVFDNC